MDNRVAVELLRTREALKQKYKNLKMDIDKSQSQLEKTYKPITQPLKDLMSTLIKTESSPLEPHLKKELKNEINRESLNIRPIGQTPLEYYKTASPIHLEDETFQYDPTQVRPEIRESFFDETFPATIANTSTAAEHEKYLQQFKKPLPRAYIEGKIEDVNNEYDDTFGVYFDPFAKKYAIGDATIDFDGADFIINDQFKYGGTPGLYELMFKKHPAGYRPADVDQYIDIIKRANVHYLSYDPEKGLSTSNAPKFIDIIKPRVTNLYSMAQERNNKKTIISKKSVSIPTTMQRSRSSSLPTSQTMKTRSQNKKGGNLKMMEFNNKQIEYKHFKDYNVLVDRLRLLIASQLAGNTGHNNEITSIIEKLREGKIIK